MKNLPPDWQTCDINEAANVFVSATGKIYELEIGETVIKLENGHRVGYSSFTLLGIHPVKRIIPKVFRVGNTEEGQPLIIYKGREYSHIPRDFIGVSFEQVFK